MRAEIAARQIREQGLRAAVSWFRALQERWGHLTLAQIRQLRRLLGDHADVIYRLADRVERGEARPRLPKKHGVRVLAGRVARAGREDDPVTRDVLVRLGELAEASERWPRATPRALRELAIEVLAKCVAHNLCCVVKAIFTAGLAPTFWSDAPAVLPTPAPALALVGGDGDE